MKKTNKNNEPEEMSFWQSYSDMMAALLLVFVLIISATLISGKLMLKDKQNELSEQRKKLLVIQEEIEAYKEKLGASEEELEEARRLLLAREADLEDAEESLGLKNDELDSALEELELQRLENNNQEMKLAEQQQKLDQVVGVRTEVIQKLSGAFEDSNIPVTVDSDTGSITFESGVLFATGHHELTKEGEAFLDSFFPKYFSVIMSDDVRDYVSEVIIEGHTDDVGEYLTNLKLSQERAYAVAEYCLGNKNNMFDADTLAYAKEIVTANGRSFMELVRDSNGNVDRDSSRRVEIEFRLTEQQMIEEISEILEKN